jgi:hypothetical protein
MRDDGAKQATEFTIGGVRSSLLSRGGSELEHWLMRQVDRLLEAERDLAALRRRVGEAARMFPVLQAPRGAPTRVPWALLAPFEGHAIRNHDQDLETLARRGGLSVAEMVAVIEGKRLREMERSDEAALPRLLAALDVFSKTHGELAAQRAAAGELRGMLREAVELITTKAVNVATVDVGRLQAFTKRPDVLAATKEEPGT